MTKYSKWRTFSMPRWYQRRTKKGGRATLDPLAMCPRTRHRTITRATVHLQRPDAVPGFAGLLLQRGLCETPNGVLPLVADLARGRCDRRTDPRLEGDANPRTRCRLAVSRRRTWVMKAQRRLVEGVASQPKPHLSTSSEHRELEGYGKGYLVTSDLQHFPRAVIERRTARILTGLESLQRRPIELEVGRQ